MKLKRFLKKHPEFRNKPVNLTLGWDFMLHLGFLDGTYMPNEIAKILYPQYFDGNGNIIENCLPIDCDGFVKKFIEQSHKFT